MSEWAMILLGLTLAGGAVLYIPLACGLIETRASPNRRACSSDYVADDRYIAGSKISAEPAGPANARCEVNTSAHKNAGDSWTMTDSTEAEAFITITVGQ